jgi:uncharacterized protein YndB with AHSA1/START domain
VTVPVLEERVEIAAPIEGVFELLADPARGPEWTPNLLSVEPLQDGQAAGPGAETRLLVNMAGRPSKGTGRCVEWDPPHRLVLASSLDLGVNSTTTFQLTPTKSGTAVAARVEYTLTTGALGRLVGGLLGDSLARRDLRKALANLKAQVERNQVG